MFVKIFRPGKSQTSTFDKFQISKKWQILPVQKWHFLDRKVIGFKHDKMCRNFQFLFLGVFFGVNFWRHLLIFYVKILVFWKHSTNFSKCNTNSFIQQLFLHQTLNRSFAIQRSLPVPLDSLQSNQQAPLIITDIPFRHLPSQQLRPELLFRSVDDSYLSSFGIVDWCFTFQSSSCTRDKLRWFEVQPQTL